MPTVIAVLLLAVLAAACGNGGGDTAHAWLHGTWELTFNPEHDSEDDLEFRRDGSVRVHTENKHIIDGMYQVSNDELLMVLVVNDKPVDVRFEISPDRTRLTYKNGAWYTKKPAS